VEIKDGGWPLPKVARENNHLSLLIVRLSRCRELSRFIAAGRLHCKIDKVGGIVETNRPDSKNYQYQVCCG